MTTVQLLGRGTYGPHIAMGPGVSPLWQYKKSVPAQNTVLIYEDGTVEERAGVSNLTLLYEGVRTWIYGGTDYRTFVGSWEYNALTAAGYTWREVPAQGEYTEDYQDNYNEAWGKAIFDENAAALAEAAAEQAAAERAATLASQIATLEAQLLALRGY